MESEGNRTNLKSKRVFACKSRREEDCDPDHPTHKGNRAADLLAGEHSQGGHDTPMWEIARGEKDFVLTNGESIAEGSYSRWLKGLCTKKLHLSGLSQIVRPTQISLPPPKWHHPLKRTMCFLFGLCSFSLFLLCHQLESSIIIWPFTSTLSFSCSSLLVYLFILYPFPFIFT